MRFIAPGLLVLLLTACVTGRNEFVAAVPMQDKGPVVYLYRPHDAANALLNPEISIDATDADSIGNGEYRMFYLKPGQHSILLHAIAGYTPDQQLSLKLETNSVYYLRLDSSIRFEASLRYRPYQRTFVLQQVETATALAEISLCRDADTVSAKQAAREADVEAAGSQQSETHFSTDKTANPFSH